MKISGFKKTFPIIVSALVSAVTFALFVTYQNVSDQSGQWFSSSAGIMANDTIPNRKINPQDSLYNALLGAADKYYIEKNYEKSLAELVKAQQIKPQDQVLKERISKMRGLAATQNEQGNASQKSVASGDAYFKSKDYLV